MVSVKEGSPAAVFCVASAWLLLAVVTLVAILEVLKNYSSIYQKKDYSADYNDYEDYEYSYTDDYDHVDYNDYDYDYDYEDGELNLPDFLSNLERPG